MSITVVPYDPGFVAVCDGTITTYDHVSRQHSQEVCAWTATHASEERALHLGEQHELGHRRNAETVAVLERAKRDDRPHEHVHGPQCTLDSCPSAYLYYHVNDDCPPAGTKVCAGHPLPSRNELVAASKKKRGR